MDMCFYNGCVNFSSRIHVHMIRTYFQPRIKSLVCMNILLGKLSEMSHFKILFFRIFVKNSFIRMSFMM